MIKVKENCFLGNDGKPVGVFVDIKQYRKWMREVEELEEIRAYDKAKSSREKAIPFEKAVQEIERKRS